MLWMTLSPFSMSMTEWVVMVDDISWLGMTSRHVGHVNWEPRWWDGMYCCIWETLVSSRGKVEPDDLTIVEASWLSSRQFQMHTRATCMAEQTLILHELYLVGEDKPHVMFDKGYKGQNKINMGLPLRLVLHKSGQDNCKLESRRFCGLTSDRI